MTYPLLRLGTRSSPLARWQADWVAARLQELGITVELTLITTQGDVTTGSLSQIGGQGLFTKEIQRALLDERIDLAVHSLKDLPTSSVDGLVLAAIPPRESTADALISAVSTDIVTLPRAARIGTGSLRRQAQLRHLRPDLVCLEIRGNVDTRLRKLADGEYDAIVLAEAGLKRLGLADRISYLISPNVMLPAVGQGALGIEARANDEKTIELLRPLNHAPSRQAVTAERSLLSALRGGCLAPVGAAGRVENGRLHLDGVVLSGDGQQRLFATGSADVEEALELGETIAEQLLAQGAAGLIAAARGG